MPFVPCVGEVVPHGWTSPSNTIKKHFCELWSYGESNPFQIPGSSMRMRPTYVCMGSGRSVLSVRHRGLRSFSPRLTRRQGGIVVKNLFYEQQPITGFVEVCGVEPLSVPGTEIPTLFNLFLSVSLPSPSPRILVSRDTNTMFRFILLATAHARSRLVGALCLTWKTLTLHPFMWASVESNHFHTRHADYCSSGSYKPKITFVRVRQPWLCPFRPSNP